MFLWIAVLKWGTGVGAKLFDLRVLAGSGARRVCFGQCCSPRPVSSGLWLSVTSKRIKPSSI